MLRFIEGLEFRKMRSLRSLAVTNPEKHHSNFYSTLNPAVVFPHSGTDLCVSTAGSSLRKTWEFPRFSIQSLRR